YHPRRDYCKRKNDIVITDLEIGDVTLARKLYDSGKFVFVDARSRDDYEEGHIKGAVSLPVGEFDEKIDVFLEEYLSEKAIVRASEIINWPKIAPDFGLDTSHGLF
ncbi:MAG: rhodanese-like domain-containing protein, partial [Thermodesulfobacteriota bacterium]|nr:rhodanese-like domain-containing protein [Thermodesulfobacteriota bacterium]